jgi:hypothetical protein
MLNVTLGKDGKTGIVQPTHIRSLWEFKLRYEGISTSTVPKASQMKEPLPVYAIA